MAVGYTLVTGNFLCDAKSDLLAEGLIWFQPISTSSGQNIAFRAGPAPNFERATLEAAVFAVVSDGVFSISLADCYLTTPKYVAYRVWVQDLVTGETWHMPGYGNFMPTGAAYDFDTWEPDLTGLVTVQIGPEGPPGIPGGIAGLTMPQQVPSGAIDGTNVVYQVLGVPALPLYFANGLYQAVGVDYSIQADSATGTSTITRLARVLQPANADDPADTHYFVGFTSGASVSGGGSVSPSASVVPSLPLQDQDGSVVSLQIRDGQFSPIQTFSYVGISPPSEYLFVDEGTGTTWAIVSVNKQVDPIFVSASLLPNAVTSYVFTDAGNASLQFALKIKFGQIVVDSLTTATLAPLSLPLADSTGDAMALTVLSGQIKLAANNGFTGATPSNYLLIDDATQSTWQIVSVDHQLKPQFVNSAIATNALDALIVTDSSDGSTQRVVTIFNGQIKVA